MRRNCLVLLLAFILGSCAPTATIVGGGGAPMNEVLRLPYDGPKARIAVAKFDDRTARGYGQIGEGMAAMFTTGLVNSNRYIVLERDLVDDIIREQDLAVGGRVRTGTGAPAGEIEGAELLLIGAITEFEPEKFGLGGGIIGLGTLITTAILHEKDNNFPVGAATYTESHIALEVRLVETASSRILASISVEGRGQDWGGGVIAEVGGGSSRLPLAFGGFHKTATDKAVRKAVSLAVAAVTLQVPQEYFHYTDDVLTGGRIFGFTYLDLPFSPSGVSLSGEQVRVARNGDEWQKLAVDLGLAGNEASPPVDFSSRQVIAVAAGDRRALGRAVTVEKIVAFTDRLEVTAGLTALPAPAANGEGGGEKGEEVLPGLPVALIQTEQTGLPVKVVWLDLPEAQ